MKSLLTTFLVLFFLTLNLKSQQVLPDWVSCDLDKYISMYWLDNNREEVIALVASNKSMGELNNFELHFYDLKTRELIKKVPTNTTIVSTMMDYNSNNSLFYYKFLDTVCLINKNDYSLEKKLILPFSYQLCHLFKYNAISNKYSLFSKRTKELIVARFKQVDYSLIKFDTLKIDTSYNYSIRVSDNGNYFALKTGDSTVMVYETETMKHLRTVKTNFYINQYHISDDGKWLAIYTNFITDQSCLLFNLEDSKLDFFVTNHFYGVPPRIKFSPKGNYFLLSFDSYTYVYNISTKELTRKISPPNAFYFADFCLDDTKIIDIAKSRELVLSDISNKTEVKFADFSKYGKIFNISTVCFNEPGDKYFVSGNEGTMSLRKTQDANIEDEFTLNGGSINIMNRKIKDTIVTFSYTDYKLKYTDTKTKKTLDSFNLQGLVRYMGCMSEDMKWYASVSVNSKIFLCNINDYKLEQKKYLFNSGVIVTNLAFSSDSKMLAVGLLGNIVNIYKIDEIENSTEPFVTLTYPSTQLEGSINYMKFIDDNTKLVTSSFAYNKFLVWDLEDGDIVKNPICPVEHFSKGEFPTIKYLEYREKFHDYITTDSWGNILFWDKNFEFTNFIKVSKSLGFDIAIAFDYNQNTNDLLIGCSYSTMAKLNLDFITNVESPQQFYSNFILFPNPASDYITVSIPQNIFSNHTIKGMVENGLEKVHIFNTFGIELTPTPPSVVIEQTGTSDGLRIDISNLSAGVYFVKIGDNVEKFVKM